MIKKCSLKLTTKMASTIPPRLRHLAGVRCDKTFHAMDISCAVIYLSPLFVCDAQGYLRKNNPTLGNHRSSVLYGVPSKQRHALTDVSYGAAASRK